MWQNLLQNVLAPVARRLGSLAGGAVLAFGAEAELVAQTETVVAGLVLVAIDLVASHINRQALRRSILKGTK